MSILMPYENYPNPVVLLDTAGKPRQFNQAWYRYTGMLPDLAEKNDWKKWIHPDDLQKCSGTILSRHGPFNLPLRLLHVTNEYLSGSLFGIPMYTDLYEYNGMLGIWYVDGDTKIDPFAGQKKPDIFYHALEAAPVACILSDQHGKTIYSNSAAQTLLGKEKGDKIGAEFASPDWQITDLEGHPLTRDDCPVLSAIKKKKPHVSSPVKIITSHHHWKVLTFHSTPLLDQKEQVEFVITIIKDITSETEAYQKLSESEERYRSLFTQLRDGFALHEILCDNRGKPCDYRFLEVNPAFEKMLGLTAEEIVGKTVLEILPDLEPFWIETYGKVALMGEPARFEKFTASLGRYFDIFAYSPKPGLFAALSIDITERKEIERKVFTEHEKLVNVMEAMTDGICLMNVDKEIQYTNPAFRREFGDIQGMKCADYFQPCIIPCDLCPDNGIYSGTPIYWQWTNERSGKIYELHTTPLYSRSPEMGVLILFHDITDHKNLEKALHAEQANLTQKVEERTAELSLVNAALVSAARMKDEFLASMSHELRTPLTGVLGLTEALRQQVYGEITPKQDTALEGIEESGRHLLALINDILDLSKIEAGKDEIQLSPARVGEICQASLRMIKRDALKRNLRVSFDQDLNVTLIQTDARRLKQILVNLLSNAVKFTPKGGEIGLSVTGKEERAEVYFTVWDSGIGIAEEDKPQLFKPFTQLDRGLAREYSGSGLGLALVQRMITRLGGTVQVDSELGKGSRFTVTLPWQENVPSLVNSAESSLQVSSFFHKVLIVEESEIVSAQLARYAVDLGLSPVIHNGGTGVIEKTITVTPDLILLELVLPDNSGWDVLRELKNQELTRHIPVIVISILDERARAASLGVLGYLVKPVTYLDLKAALLEAGMRWTTGSALRITPDYEEGKRPRPLVLLVDDNEMTLEMLTDYLSVKKYRTAVAHDGIQALQEAHAKQPQMIIMDVQMPGLDGLEAIRQIRNDAGLKNIPILALTALAMPGDRERCLAAGADEYLAKPVSLKHLSQTLEKYSNHWQYPQNDG